MKYKLLLIMSLFMVCFRVNALSYGGCEYKQVSNLRSVLSNINISYDYKEIDSKIYFDVTISNLTSDLYFEDTQTRKIYTYADAYDGDIVIANYTGISGSYRFYSALDDCYGLSIGIKYYKFPTYNRYYNTDVCEEIPNFSLCGKWIDVKYNYDDFMKLADEYKNGSKESDDEPIEVEVEKNFLTYIIEFYIKYYYYFLGAIIMILGSIVLIKNHKEKNKILKF